MSILRFDIRLLESFVVLADEDLSFKAAAKLLGVGQPSLSRQIARLERQLHSDLVVRDERHSLLTPAGERLLPHARAVLRRANALHDELHADTNALRLHLGSGDHRGALDVVAAFMSAHPSTRVEITEGSSPDARRAVREHAVDVSFDLRTEVVADQRFQLLDRSPLGVLTHADHPLARRGSAAWDDLAGERVLFGDRGDGSWAALVRGCLAEAGVIVVEEIAPAMAKLHYLAPIIAGGAVSMITARALFDPLPEGVTWIPLTPHRHLEYGLIWDPSSCAAPVQRFVAFARQHAEVPPPEEPDAAPGREHAGGAVNAVGTRPEFDLRLVLPFVTVAEEMHFGRAADKMTISQPALSRQVARLEHQLGVTLLDRSSRAVELTEAGRLTLLAGRDILDTALRAGMSVAADTPVTGRIDVHIAYAAQPVLAGLIGSFAACHPDIEVRIGDGGTQTAATAIAAGTADIGFGFGFAVPAGLRYIRLGDIEQGVHCAESHRLAHRRSIRWHDLEGEAVLVPATGVTDEYKAWLHRMLADRRLTVTEVVTNANRALLVGSTLVAGNVVAVGAESYFSSVPGLRWVPFDPPECLEQGVVWNDDTAGPAVRSFLHWISSARSPSELVAEF